MSHNLLYKIASALFGSDRTNLHSIFLWVPKDSIGLEKLLAKVQKGVCE